ncbi:MAG: hypothetical protein GDA53_02765 [Rhodobacteraceae bacterium]|nr:hypothetical protein [Paracoccaceae bacterium]
MPDIMNAGVLVIGHGLATASEAAAHGKSVILMDWEGEQSIGGQAF